MAYGTTRKEFDIPDGFLQGQVIKGAEISGAPPEVETNEGIERALLHPTGRPRVREMARGKRVCVVLPDEFRAGKPEEMLKAIARELMESGYESLIVLCATGSHEPPRFSTKTKGLFDKYFSGFPNVSFHANDIHNDEYLRLGTTSRGTPALFNKKLMETEFRIYCHEGKYHYMNGYSCIDKLVLPGMAGLDTIAKNHMLSLESDRSSVGRNPYVDDVVRQDNPMAQDIHESREMSEHFIFRSGGLVKEDAQTFSLEMVSGKKGLFWVQAGDLDTVEREMTRQIDSLFRRIVKRTRYVLLSPGGPPQSTTVYSAQNAFDMALKGSILDGGEALIIAPCDGSPGLPDDVRGLAPDTAMKGLFWDTLVKLKDEPYSKARKWLEENFQLGLWKTNRVLELFHIHDLKIYLHCTLPERYIRDGGFIPCPDPQKWLEERAARCDGKLNVIDEGNRIWAIGESNLGEAPACSATQMMETYGDYLRDESNSTGSADRMFFPVDEADLSKIFERSRMEEAKITFSGGRTGITGGCVPDGGWLVSFERMDRFLGLRYDTKKKEFYVRCHPGVLLKDLQECLASRQFRGSSGWDAGSKRALDRFVSSDMRYILPPDPTETTSQLGGNVACNASGGRTYKYGPMRGYVQALRVLLQDGSMLDIKRGKIKAKKGRITLTADEAVGEGRKFVLDIPAVSMPDTKNAAGYYLAQDMDLIDLFIGSEGTLGAITEMELRLIPEPAKTADLLAFLPNEDDALMFVEALRNSKADIAALEYLCPGSLAFLERFGSLKGSGIPSQTLHAKPAVVIISLEAQDGNIESQLEIVAAVLEATGLSEAKTMVALDAKDKERFKILRHGVPEAVNATISQIKREHPGIRKLGTDLAVPFECLRDMVKLYRARLDALGLEYVMFGHIGNAHLHVNIIPRDPQQYSTGKQLYIELARAAVAMGGTVSGEHGIGKLKREMLEVMYPPEAIAGMKRIKSALDPEWMLNPGNLFKME